MIAVDSDHHGTVKISGEATVYEIEELCEKLRAAVKEPSPSWVLDLSGLTDLDSCGAQLLLAFKRSQGQVSVHSCPQNLRTFLEQTGLAPLLL